MNYVAPWWLPGGNLQTIWPALYSKRSFGPSPDYRRERWDSPDGDFIDVDWLADPNPQPVDRDPVPVKRPLLVLFHGLEGSSRSHYAEAFADYARSRGMGYAVPHFRGCSGEINRAPRAYHSGDHEEVDWILRRFKTLWCARGGGDVVVVGVSLGGNALLLWAGECGQKANELVRAVVAISPPLDLAASGRAIGSGFNRRVYTRMFLNTMKPRALEKLAQHPGLFDRTALMAAQDLHAFDNVFTAPLHGFKSTDDYWARASAKPHLHRIRIPALAVNALNDPFVPAKSLPVKEQVGAHVTLWQPAHGGHAGFADGRPPGHVRSLPDRIGSWLDKV
jgi:uncharacterized protein